MSKKCYVLMRVLVMQDKTNVRFPVGVYSDQADAQRAGDAFVQTLQRLAPEASQLLAYVGIVGVAGVVVEQDFTAGAGLTLVSGLMVDGNGRPIAG
jgi:hypothetical protein